MVCRHILYPQAGAPGSEWVPPGLMDGICQLRKSDPKKWALRLRELGVEVDEDDFCCMQNLDGNWEECPLCQARPGPSFRLDIPRNEHGFPLFL